MRTGGAVLEYGAVDLDGVKIAFFTSCTSTALQKEEHQCPTVVVLERSLSRVDRLVLAPIHLPLPIVAE